MRDSLLVKKPLMSNLRWLMVILILLLGASFRILHLADQSFWVDEGYAFYHAYFPNLMESLARDTHPPLYFAALRLWSMLAGQSELALRWFSVLPSMLGIAVIFQLAREVQWQRRRGDASPSSGVPLLAMLMLALADAEHALAQEARHYTWLALWVLCAMWFFLRWIRRAKRGDYGWWLLFTIVMVHTHYITAFVGGAQGLYALAALSGRSRKQALSGLVMSAMALIPWLALVGVHQLGNRGANWSVSLSAAVARDIQVKYFSEQWALVIALMLLGCVSLAYSRDGGFRVIWHRVSWLLLFWLIVPLALTILVNEFLPFLQPRRLNQWVPVIALLVALGLGNIRQPIRSLLIGVLVVYGVVQVDFYRVKPDWRTVAQLTARYAVPGDLVLTDIAGGDYQMAYYLRRQLPKARLLDADVRYESLKIQRDFYPQTYQSWLPQLLQAHQTVWLMYWSDDDSALGWLDKLGFRQTADFVYRHDGGLAGEVRMHIFRFDRLDEAELAARFENGMILQSAWLDVDDLRVDLLWRTGEQLQRDYAISAKLLNQAGAVAAQLDSQPQLNQRPTSGWQVGEVVYSPHDMQLTGDALSAGEYQVAVQVYEAQAGGLVNVRTERGAEWVVVGGLRVGD